MSSITIFERLEPRPRANDLGTNVAAGVYDPLWFLTRQWQIGEFQGRDAGSLAYVDYFGSQATLPRFVIQNQAKSVDPGIPLEKQTLAEPIEPDFSLRVELGQLFASLLGDQFPDPADADTLKDLLDAFLANFGLQNLTSSDELDPIDPSTRRFLTLCVGRTVDGYALYQLAQGLAAGTTPFPANIPEEQKVRAALADLLEHVQQTLGALGATDPAAWTANRLEYSLQVVAVDPGGAGNATLKATPNSKGEFDWYSFDVVAKNATASETPPVALHFTTTPSSARFPGMPSPRFWYMEENSIAYVDVKLDPTDIVMLLATDMMLVHGSDWFLLPFDQPLGTAVATKGIVVTDVFGHRNLVQAANKPAQPAGLDRWAMFANSDEAAGQRLTNYFIVPPSPGSLAQDGTTLEDVRFARDEVADMAWAIERTTQSPIGEPRSGRERDAEIDASQTLPPPLPGEPSAPLRYQVESRVPANWIPFLGVQVDANDPSIQFEKAAMLHPKSTGIGIVPPIGRFLRATPYRIVSEEIPRDGLQVMRTVSRSRWIDGSTHLWVSRRRLLGSGEAQSGLRFDSALPNET
jgi:hypothetical protein